MAQNILKKKVFLPRQMIALKAVGWIHTKPCLDTVYYSSFVSKNKINR